MTVPKILAVLHQERSTPGRIGLMLQARGYRIEACRPRSGERLPGSLDEYAGAVVFGGPMSANDTDNEVRTETDWFAVPLSEQAPVLGVCLGAQLLTRHLGSEVRGHADGLVEAGYYPIYPTAAGRAIAPWPEKVYQWHAEGLDLPNGAELLAQSELFPCQAYRYGQSAFAVQFHPEVTLAMMHRWTVRGTERLSLPGAKPRAQHFAERAIYDADVVVWLEAFIDYWLASDPR